MSAKNYRDRTAVEPQDETRYEPTMEVIPDLVKQELVEKPDPPPKPVPLYKEPKSSKPSVQTSESFFVYLGPSIRGSIAHNQMLFGNRKAVEKRLQSTFEKYPLVKNLLVPGSALAADRAQVKKPGTLLNRLYTEMVGMLAKAE